MRFISLGYLKLGLDDLLGSRAQALSGTQSFVMYQPILQSQQQKIAALPESLRRRRPLREELGLLNIRHDLGGSSLWHLCMAVEECPLSSDEEIGAARRVRNTLVPARKVLSAAYPEQVSAAKLNRSKVAGLEADLKLLSFVGGKSAYDIAQIYIEAGENMGVLLGNRSTAEAHESLRQEAQALRGQSIKYLGNFREALRDEVEMNASLPRNLEAMVFAYLDELEEQCIKTPSKGDEEDAAAESKPS